MQTVEKLVLKAAFQAPGGFDLYDLHLKFRLSPTIVSGGLKARIKGAENLGVESGL